MRYCVACGAPGRPEHATTRSAAPTLLAIGTGDAHVPRHGVCHAGGGGGCERAGDDDGVVAARCAAARRRGARRRGAGGRSSCRRSRAESDMAMFRGDRTKPLTNNRRRAALVHIVCAPRRLSRLGVRSRQAHECETTTNGPPLAPPTAREN